MKNLMDMSESDLETLQNEQSKSKLASSLERKEIIQKPQEAKTAQEAFFERIDNSIRHYLPEKEERDLFKRNLLHEMRMTPKLEDCDRTSIINACITATQLKLSIVSTLGLGYIIPFNESKLVNGKWEKIPKANFILGYRGKITLLAREGIHTFARKVYKGDKFDPNLDELKTNHVIMDEEQEEISHYYVLFRKNNETIGLEILPKKAADNMVEKIRKEKELTDKSSSPWVKHTNEMIIKTMIRRAFKYLPIGTKIAEIIENDKKLEEETIFNSEIQSLEKN